MSSPPVAGGAIAFPDLSVSTAPPPAAPARDDEGQAPARTGDRLLSGESAPSGISAANADDHVPAAERLTVIEPSRGWASLDLGEVWRYRDLFLTMVWRDISARYRQSLVGIGWVVVKPIVSMVIFAFIFGRVAGIKSDGTPYPLFAFTALLPWMYFSGALSSATMSVVSTGSLLKKVYFPRLLLPLIGITVSLIELLIQLVILAVLIAGYHLAAPIGADGAVWRFDLSPRLLMAPALVLICMATALAVGLWLTALNVKYRDIGQAVPFLTQAWMWLSPIVYPSSLVPEHLRMVYGLNPMVGVIEGFRWSLLGSPAPDWTMVIVSGVVVVALLVSGLFFFQRTEASFADVI